jgi:hypothetical protein
MTPHPVTLDIAALEARIVEGLQNDHSWPFDGKVRGDAFAALDALVSEVERLRAENAALVQTSADLCPACGWRFLVPGDGCLNCEVADLRMQRDEHLIDTEHAHAEGRDTERDAAVAFLRTVAPNAPTRRGADELVWCADRIERGEHRREEAP